MKPTSGSAESLLEHAAFLKRLARAMLHEHDADDVVQETWLRALQSPPKDPGAARSWLAVVARRTAWRQGSVSRSRRDREKKAARSERTRGTLETAERLEQERRVVDAVQRLPEPYRTTLVLRYFDGLKPREIAAREDTPIETVRSRLQRGLRALRKDLGPDTSCALALAIIAGGPPRVAPLTGVFVMSTAQKVGAVVIAAVAITGATILATNAGEPATVRQNTELAVLREENESLRARLHEALARNADSASAGLARPAADAGAPETSTKSASAASSRKPDPASRSARWKEIQDTLAPSLAILDKMQKKGANQLQLGPQLVAELGKVGVAKFDEIMEFDATETDPEVVADIRIVMRQALIFLPGLSDAKDGYLERYLERARSGRFGDRFTEQALRRVSFSMPPFLDAYKSIVDPLDDELKNKFVDEAIERAARGTSIKVRFDGVTFLARVPDPRATNQLMRVLTEHAAPQALRLAALKGLSTRTGDEVLSMLKDTATTDPDATIRARAAQAVQALKKQAAAPGANGSR